VLCTYIVFIVRHSQAGRRMDDDVFSSTRCLGRKRFWEAHNSARGNRLEYIPVQPRLVVCFHLDWLQGPSFCLCDDHGTVLTSVHVETCIGTFEGCYRMMFYLLSRYVFYFIFSTVPLYNSLSYRLYRSHFSRRAIHTVHHLIGQQLITYCHDQAGKQASIDRCATYTVFMLMSMTDPSFVDVSVMKEEFFFECSLLLVIVII